MTKGLEPNISESKSLHWFQIQYTSKSNMTHDNMMLKYPTGALELLSQSTFMMQVETVALAGLLKYT